MFSSAVSEPPYRVHLPVSSNGVKEQQKPRQLQLRRQKLETILFETRIARFYIALNYKKKASKKNVNRKLSYNERPTTPDVFRRQTLSPSAKVEQRGKKKFRTFHNRHQNGSLVCNGSVMRNKTERITQFRKTFK